MIKTQLNPFHRLYTIKLALEALLLYGKSGLNRLETKEQALHPVFYSKNYQIYTIVLEEFHKSVIFWH